MLGSSRFVIGIHILAILARCQDRELVCSTFIARSVNTNPVVIRRLMASLEGHGMVRSVAGRNGGFALSRPAHQITLQEVFSALEGEKLFRRRVKEPCGDCPVGAFIAKAIAQPLKAAEDAMSAALSRTTLKDVVAAIP
jgi:Rrf2 family protein